MLRLQLLLAMFFPAGLVHLGLATPTVLAAAVTAVLAIGLVYTVLRVVIVAVDAEPAPRRSTGVRARARLSAFLRLRDPDAAGRPRPRAPGAQPAIAG